MASFSSSQRRSPRYVALAAILLHRAANYSRIACLCALLALPLSAATVYLPAPGPLVFLPVTGATNASPVVVTINNHGLSNGAAVWCQNIGGNQAANGYFSITGATANTFQLTYLYFGGSVSGTGTYSSGGTCTPLTGYNTINHPRVML